MNSQEAIKEGFIAYPYNFPAIKFIVRCKGKDVVAEVTKTALKAGLK